jgi:hypothetical protein
MIEDIKEGQVRVSLEGFGGKSLVAVLERKDVEGRTFEQVIGGMNLQTYSGRDKETLVAIQRQMSSSGGYRSLVGVGTPNRFEPVGLGEKVAPYIQDAQGLGNAATLRTAVLGKHILGEY